MSAIQLPAETEERLARLAEAARKTKAFHAHEAILSHLDDLEGLHLAECRLLDSRSRTTQAVPLEDALMSRQAYFSTER